MAKVFEHIGLTRRRERVSGLTHTEKISMRFLTNGAVRRKAKRASVLALVGGWVFACGAHAGNYTVFNTKVDRYIVSGDIYAGCMVRLEKDPKALAPACGARWVTLDCNGDTRAKSVGQSFFSVAQAAQLLGKSLHVYFTDDVIVNGYCRADRLDAVD